MIIHGDSLHKLKELQDNSVDSIVTDPPYFLTNSSGSGFMGKEWDSLSVANAFAESALKSLSPVWLMGVESSVPENANTNTRKKSAALNINALYVQTKSIAQNHKLSLGTFSVLESVLTKAEVLVLSKELCPELTPVFEKQSENVAYVLNSTCIENCPKLIALNLATQLHKASVGEDLQILNSLMEDPKASALLGVMDGKIYESSFISETILSARSVESIVVEKRYNVTTSSLIELQRIIRWITSSLSVSSAMATFMEIPGNNQILSERFHYKWAKEVLRVLKPGGYLLAFAGTRTYHPLAKAIEDAGFEIRDQIQWIYGSGFPKSTNVALRIDKESGAIGHRGKGFNAAGQGIRLNQNKELRSDHPGYAPPEYKTPEAKKYQGWGTALKPANEPICVARKPLSESTVAKNVLRWGTGGLNIDGSRITGGGPKGEGGRLKAATGSASQFNGGNHNAVDDTSGRWPANIILDEEAAAVLDEQADDNVSRFFYVAKASKKERNAGLEGMPKSKKHSRYGDGLGNAPTIDGVRATAESNHHPTVKPIKLMEYLIKLVTPEGGTVLDPFMGSGTTGIAAKNLGFNFVGIELSEEYVEIAKKRIEAINVSKQD